MFRMAPCSCALPKPLSVRESRFYLYTTLFVAGNILFPALCHLVPGGGPMLLPIYFFTLIAGYRFGWAAGLATAILSPLANHLLTGMPPASILPIILVKSVFLALSASTASRWFGLSIAGVALAVVGYQAAGGIVEWFMTGSWAEASADLQTGLPGVFLQLTGGYAVLRLLHRGE